MLRFDTFSPKTPYKIMSSLWMCGYDPPTERSFKTKWVHTWTNASNNDPHQIRMKRSMLWKIITYNRFTDVMLMYLTILLYQIKYVISKTNRKITHDLSRYIILFSDVNHLRLSLLRIWVRHAIISDKVILIDFIHSHTAIGTTTFFLI